MNTAILLTGASGFLAGDLLPRLVEHYPTATIYLLLRATDSAALAERHQAIIDRVGLNNEAAQRVVAIAGDVEQPDLGLGSQYQTLAAQITEIYHSAANTRFDQSIETARKVNFAGAQHVFNFACQAQQLGNLKRYHHISTAYVAGNRLGVIKETELACGQGFFNTYEQSKYESEMMLRAQTELPVTIYRPSIIAGDSRTGQTVHFLVIYEPMKWVYFGQVPFLPCRPEAKLDIVPIDYVCDAIVALGKQPATLGGTYHLAAGPDRSINMIELVDSCMAEFNKYNEQVGKPPVNRPEIITPEMIANMGVEGRQKSETFFKRAWQQMQRHLPYVTSEKIFDDSATQAALVGTNIVCPHFREYLPTVVGYALEKQFRA